LGWLIHNSRSDSGLLMGDPIRNSTGSKLSDNLVESREEDIELENAKRSGDLTRMCE
jgi:hypothetical protein